jgi:hypothetical protein
MVERFLGSGDKSLSGLMPIANSKTKYSAIWPGLLAKICEQSLKIPSENGGGQGPFRLCICR